MKTNYFLLLLFFGIALLQVKAEEITITVSDNLIDVVSGAANGDVIIIEPGLYKVNQTAISIIDKSLTIKGSDEEDKPLVYIKQISLGNTNGSTAAVGLTLENIEFSGYDVDSVTGEENVNGALTGAYFIDMTDSLKTFTDIIVRNCIIRNIGRTVLRGDRQAYTGNGFEFDNCIIYDQRDDDFDNYGPFRLNKTITFNYFKLTNSTIYNVMGRTLDFENLSGFHLDVTVNQCTFYAINGRKPLAYIVDFKLAQDLNLSVTNCIFSNINPGDTIETNFFRFAEDAGTLTTSIVTSAFYDLNIVGGGVDEVVWDQKQYVYTDDPEFVDPEKGDFTLSETSPYLEASLDLTPIGDLRWTPGGIEFMNSNQSAKTLNIYPNPASQILNVKSDMDIYIGIYTITGLLVKRVYLFKGNNIIDVSVLKSGLYLMKDGHNLYSAKIAIK